MNNTKRAEQSKDEIKLRLPWAKPLYALRRQVSVVFHDGEFLEKVKTVYARYAH